MVIVEREVEFDMGHRVPSHEGMCRNPHGHRYRVVLAVTGPVQTEGPEDGMVIDFGRIKNFLQSVHDRWDHGFMVHEADPLLGHLRAASDALGGFRIIESDFVPTAENLAASIARQAAILRPLHVVEVTVWETPKSRAIWRSPRTATTNPSS